MRDPAALTEALRSLDPLSYLRLAYASGGGLPHLSLQALLQ